MKIMIINLNECIYAPSLVEISQKMRTDRQTDVTKVTQLIILIISVYILMGPSFLLLVQAYFLLILIYHSMYMGCTTKSGYVVIVTRPFQFLL